MSQQTLHVPSSPAVSGDARAATRLRVDLPHGGGRKSRLASDRGHMTALIGIDFLAACASLPLTLLLLAEISTIPDNSLTHLASNLAKDAAFAPSVVAGLAISGLYRSTRHALRPSILRQLKDVVFAIGTGFMLALAASVLVHVIWHTNEPSSTQLLLAVLVASALIAAGRTGLNAYVNTFATSRVLVVGTGALADRIVTCVKAWAGMELVGRVAPDDSPDPDAIGI